MRGGGASKKRLLKQEKQKDLQTGFTLSEVLITLGIIGIVAAMTLPALINKYQERVLVVSAKRSYAIVTNALMRWNADNDMTGDYLSFFSSYGSDVERLRVLTKYMNTVQFCTQDKVEPCGGKYEIKQYKKLNDGHGNTAQFDLINWWRAVLVDGTFITLQSEVENGSCIHKYWSYETDADGNYIPDDSSPNGYKGKETTSYTCGVIVIDTNGLKSPNQVGRDVFGIAFSQKGPEESQNSTRGNINYVLKNDKLIDTEGYTIGKFE